MGSEGLIRAVRNGAPLIEIVVKFRKHVDPKSATAIFNALGDDIDLNPGDWYNDRFLRVGAATKESLARLFAWRIVRVPYGEAGALQTYYMWHEVAPAKAMPASLQGMIESIGFSQPGTDDDGQWYE